MAIITTNISQAAEVLIAGNIIGLPTETVYGLAGNMFNESALRAIYETKHRPLKNPLIAHIASIARLSEVAAHIPPAAMQLAEAFWPGPLTLVLPKQPHVPLLATAQKSTVAIRIPNHALALELLNAIDFPLAAPSANPFGTISPTSAQHVANYFHGKIPLILDGGACTVGIESTIIGFQGNQPVLYRHGSLSLEQIEAVVGKVIQITENETAPDAPGMLAKHYSPLTPLIFTKNIVQVIAQFAAETRIGILAFQSFQHSVIPVQQIEILSPSGNTYEAATNLYAALHRLDALKLDLIIAEELPPVGLGNSINDRLNRAAK